MNLIWHFLVCTILSVILFPFIGWPILLLFVLGFFIDVDHYWWHISKTGNVSLINAYNDSRNPKVKHYDLLHIFHVYEFWIPMAILGFFNKYLFLIALGMMIHLFMDFSYMIYFRLGRARSMSLFSWLYRNFKI